MGSKPHTLRAGGLESCRHRRMAVVINMSMICCTLNPLVVDHGLVVHLVVGLNVRRFAVSHASVLSRIRKLVHDSLVQSPGPPLK